MNYSRRAFMGISLGSMMGIGAEKLYGQGVAAHVAKPLPRQAPSGRPFDAHFVDVGEAAGLRAPTIYGGVESKKYILESTGCGCAFIDYDNDGWMDIFLLCGTRLEGAPAGATNRLYKNNRDGTFTDVTEKAGLHAVGWACGVCIGDYNNDGFEDIFCTYFGQNILYRNNGDGTFTDVTKAAGLLNVTSRGGARDAASWTTTATDTSTCSSRTTSDSRSNMRPFPERTPIAIGREFPSNADRAGCPPDGIRFIENNGDGTFTDVSQAGGHRAGHPVLRHDGGGGGPGRGRLAGHLRRVRLDPESAVHEQP